LDPFDDRLKMLCVHCIRVMRERFDPKAARKTDSPPAASPDSDASRAI
jgi:hypothetical protein